MPATRPSDIALAALALRREFALRFGGTLHTFAATRRDGEQWQTGTRWFARQSGKTVRIKNPRGTPQAGQQSPAAGTSAGPDRPKPPAAPDAPKAQSPANPPHQQKPPGPPSPPAPPHPAGPPSAPKIPAAAPANLARGVKQNVVDQIGSTVTTPAGTTPPRRAGWSGRGIPPPARPRAVPPAAPAAPPGPAPTPAETAHYDAAQKQDTAKYGPKAAGVLRRAVEALRGFLTLGGLVGGAGIGAAIGTAVAGPLGTALGTAIGGGLGGVAGSWTPSAAAWLEGKAARARAEGLGATAARAGAIGKQAAAAVFPAIDAPTAQEAADEYRANAANRAGGRKVFTPGARTRARVRRVARRVVPVAAGVAAGGPAMAGAMGATLAGAALGGVPGAAVGMPVGAVLGHVAAATGDSAAKIARDVQATSDVSRRKAARRNRESVFAEADALPGNAVALLKARLKVAAHRAGVELPPLPDAVVRKALELASADAGVGAGAPGGRGVTKFRAKPFKMPYTPMPGGFKPRGGVGMFGEAA